jgi:hypothetical protein
MAHPSVPPTWLCFLLASILHFRVITQWGATRKGVVETKMDSQRASITTYGVPGLFEVNNKESLS